jgi:hypothetical protein
MTPLAGGIKPVSAHFYNKTDQIIYTEKNENFFLD